MYVCMYIHQIFVRRISHGNHSYCTNKMADGFRFRLRRGSCADLVSSLELMEPGDEGGRIVRNWFRIPRFLISEMSNFDDWENIDDIVINIYRSKRLWSSDWIATSMILITRRLEYDLPTVLRVPRLMRLMTSSTRHPLMRTKDDPERSMNEERAPLASRRAVLSEINARKLSLDTSDPDFNSPIAPRETGSKLIPITNDR